MQFTFTDEQEELRRTMRRFLEEKSPTSEVRRLMETADGYDEAVWKQMSQELGLAGLHIPEAYGGQGFTFVELGIVLEEMGRALLCAPFFSTVCLAGSAILAAGTEDAKKKLLPGIASGETIAAFALAEPSGRWDADGIDAVAEKKGDAYAITGTKRFVIDGATASLIVVAARLKGTKGEDGIGLFAVSGDADGLTRTALEPLDPTRKQADLELKG
ncbi:MAG: acyl-CoA dehydrogenase family protein, partial [Actinomycetota bacterium]